MIYTLTGPQRDGQLDWNTIAGLNHGIDFSRHLGTGTGGGVRSRARARVCVCVCVGGMRRLGGGGGGGLSLNRSDETQV